MVPLQQNSFYEQQLSDEIFFPSFLTKEEANQFFYFFRDCPLFRWRDANNDCEDRANAICMLLDAWKIPNAKGWVFSAYFLKGLMTGNLVNFWNYHVAAILPVLSDGLLSYYVLDPATLWQPEPIAYWASRITEQAYSYYLIKQGHYYIFPGGKIERDNWHRRDRQNFKWTMQGLSGINGVTKTGKAQVCFNKARIEKTNKAFMQLQRSAPDFLRK